MYEKPRVRNAREKEDAESESRTVLVKDTEGRRTSGGECMPGLGEAIH